MATVFTAPSFVPEQFGKFEKPSLFLGGSIEQGTAVDWQTRVTKICEATNDMFILNPRRSPWPHGADEVLMSEQINWELDALEKCDAAFMYFVPGTKSPISLLEMGMFAGANRTGCVVNRMVVCCPTGFWRKTNVDITARRYGIPVYEDFDEALQAAIMLMHKRAAIL